MSPVRVESPSSPRWGPRRKKFRWGRTCDAQRVLFAAWLCECETHTFFKRCFHKDAVCAFMKKLVPHFRRRELYSEWGRSPVAGVPTNITNGDFVGYSEEGANNSHVRGRRLILHSPSTTRTLSECFVIKARSEVSLRVCFDFGLTSLSRARKILPALRAKFFGAIP